ncbi:MAG: hypothetical protein RLZ25_1940 [Pseudomonadota bacterium]|jgi:nicotinamide-nucleotide amidase
MSAQNELEQYAARLGSLLETAGQTLVTAESCTGGGIAQAVTAIAGSSAWFDRGFVTYSNSAKTEMLAVSPALIERHGAVSEEVVKAMTYGALQASRADWVIAVSGIAGPGGGSAEKPVGTVWLAWQQRGSRAFTERALFAGDRTSVREQTVKRALEVLAEWLEVRRV